MDTTYTVTDLSRAVARSLARAFPDEVWVEGEIRDLSRSRNGHVYFALVDPVSDAEVPPILPVTLFASDRAAVNRVLVRSGAMRMTDGVHVRVRGRVSHYGPRGTVQLRMTWIDTDFTAGKLAAERRALLEKLRTAGALERNAALPVPLVPLSIGLVTSIGSAAHADFLGELESSGYRFVVVVADARVQGGDAVGSVVAALDAVARANVGVVAIVRGGGAQTDLAAFDSEPVAQAIAGCRVPVFTGIGHEVDSTVADSVAARPLKTPTACAQEIIGIVESFSLRLRAAEIELARAAPETVGRRSDRLDELHGRVTAAAGLHMRRYEETVARATSLLRRHSGRALLGAEQRTSRMIGRVAIAPRAVLLSEDQRRRDATRRLRGSPQATLGRAALRLDALDTLRRAQSPATMLARGWSVTYGERGQLVRGPADARAGERLRTVTAGGDLTSVVEEQKTGDLTP